MAETISPIAAVFTRTHLSVESQYKLAPELDKYLVSKGFNMGAGQDSDVLLWCYSFPLEDVQ